MGKRQQQLWRATATRKVPPKHRGEGHSASLPYSSFSFLSLQHVLFLANTNPNGGVVTLREKLCFYN